MLIADLRKFLTIPTAKIPRSQVIFWLVLSLAFSAVFSYLGWCEATSDEYVVQADARQHVFWMLRFIDPELFPGDRIADYFQSVAPWGYTIFYQLFAIVGLNPLLLNKLLPSVLGLITTGYCFGVCWQMLPLPVAGFIATLQLNQQLWMKDDLASATPRAFAYPLFMAFLYYLLRRSRLGVAVAIALIGLFYPHYVLVAVVILILRLGDWEHGRLRLTPNRSDYWLCYIGLAVAFLVLLPFVFKTAEYGPTLTAAAARQLPEFLPQENTEFFQTNPWKFWLYGQRSGILPRYSFTPVTVCTGFLLPVLLRFPRQFPLVRHVTSKVMLLPQMVLASLLLFFAAHALLFKLHLPSRYTGMSLWIVLSLAAAIALMAIIDAILAWAEQQTRSRWRLLQQCLALGAVTWLGVVIVFYPKIFLPGYPYVKYMVGEVPALYEFFQQQPKDSKIASIAEEADNLTSFAQRSVLVARVYAIPYQLGYYNQFWQQTQELIRAQYSPDLAQVQAFIQNYDVDFWLLERDAFTPEYLNREWVRQHQQAVAVALADLQQGNTPALLKVMPSCTVFETGDFVVLPAECINKQTNDR